ncbi:MAG: RDD family protein [Acidobacteria bacterium]|nr:RDD family protein [Acidobacteriota bacterium]
MPAPLPQWKKQLNLKLETYRSRQQSTQSVAVAEQDPPASRPDLPQPSNVIAFQSTSADDASAAVESKRPLPLEKGWRRIEKGSLALPPLQRSFAELIAEQAHPETTGRSMSGQVSLPEPAAPQEADETLRGSGAIAPVRDRAIAGVLDFSMVIVALGVFLGVFHTIGGTVGEGPEAFRTLAFAFIGLLFFYWIFYLRYVGETAGMSWMKLRVSSFDGKAPTPLQKWLRAGGTILSCCAAGMGFLWSLADEDTLTWHDRMSRTCLTRLPEESAASRSRVRLTRSSLRTLPRAARRA